MQIEITYSSDLSLDFFRITKVKESLRVTTFQFPRITLDEADYIRQLPHHWQNKMDNLGEYLQKSYNNNVFYTFSLLSINPYKRNPFLTFFTSTHTHFMLNITHYFFSNKIHALLLLSVCIYGTFVLVPHPDFDKKI